MFVYAQILPTTTIGVVELLAFIGADPETNIEILTKQIN
jgi:hypothetical protein